MYKPRAYGMPRSPDRTLHCAFISVTLQSLRTPGRRGLILDRRIEVGSCGLNHHNLKKTEGDRGPYRPEIKIISDVSTGTSRVINIKNRVSQRAPTHSNSTPLQRNTRCCAFEDSVAFPINEFKIPHPFTLWYPYRTHNSTKPAHLSHSTRSLPLSSTYPVHPSDTPLQAETQGHSPVSPGVPVSPAGTAPSSAHSCPNGA